MELEFWIFKSVPKLVDVISLNPVNSGGIHASIPTLGDKNRNLLCFLFTYSSSEIPLGYWVILYIVGKVWMRRLQRRWNRGKRFCSGGEILRSSLMNMDLGGGELILEVCLGLLDIWMATYSYLR